MSKGKLLERLGLRTDDAVHFHWLCSGALKAPDGIFRLDDGTTMASHLLPKIGQLLVGELGVRFVFFAHSTWDPVSLISVVLGEAVTRTCWVAELDRS